jgi:hypothetical protein
MQTDANVNEAIKNELSETHGIKVTSAVELSGIVSKSIGYPMPRPPTCFVRAESVYTVLSGRMMSGGFSKTLHSRPADLRRAKLVRSAHADASNC